MNKDSYPVVAVLMGGVSSEREVSLRSGRAVAAGLRQAGYTTVHEVDVRGRTLDIPAGVAAVFLTLHGEFGEDGQVQRLLEARRIPYTGAGPEGSEWAFDKLITKRKLVEAGVATPGYDVLRTGQARTRPLPVVVKPPRQGSSIGVHIVRDEAGWAKALADASAYGPDLLVEDYIAGRELTVGVVGDEVLPLVEIRAPASNYDYQAKYTKGVTEYLAPAPIDASATRLCQDLAWRTFQALRCRAMGRVDIRLTPDGRPFVLELNTLPGFTETSLLPKAARVAGYAFPALCDRIMRLAALQ